jgi:hypothetical protein
MTMTAGISNSSQTALLRLGFATGTGWSTATCASPYWGTSRIVIDTMPAWCMHGC